MNRKRLHSVANRSADSFLKRLRTKEPTALKYSKVVVRFSPRSEEYEFNLPLLPLVTHSVKLRRCIQSVFDKDGKPLAVDQEGRRSVPVLDLPDFQCDRDILRMIEDICYGVMDEKENDISTANVIQLFNAGEFLEIESVKCRASTFLEEIVFCSWENCLDVLVTFHYSNVRSFNSDLDESRTICPSSDADLEDPSHLRWFAENIWPLFERCKQAFLDNIQASYPVEKVMQDKLTKSCNVESLFLVAELLPLEVAQDIYQSCREKRLGLNMAKGTSIISYHILERDSENTSPSAVNFLQFIQTPTAQQIVKWVEKLPDVLPDLSRRSLLVLNLSRMVRLESGSTRIRASCLRWEFLCPLLVEATDLNSKTQNSGLEEELVFLEKLVSLGVPAVCNQQSACQKTVLQLLMKFAFRTLLSIVEHFKTFVCHENIVHIATVVDWCIREHLKAKSLTTQQALIIYRQFPNNARPSHVELYESLKIILALPRSVQEVRDLTSLLDYDKLTDEIVEKFFGELDLGCDPRLVKRVADIQVKRIDKENNEMKLMTLRADRKKRYEELMKLRGDKEKGNQELIQLRRDKMKIEQELIQMRNDKQKSTEELITLRSEISLRTAELMLRRVGKELDGGNLEDKLKNVVTMQKASNAEVVLLRSELDVRNQKLFAATEALRALGKKLLLVTEGLSELHQTKSLGKKTRDALIKNTKIIEGEREKLKIAIKVDTDTV